MVKTRTWNALAALKGVWLDAALFSAGCAPPGTKSHEWSPTSAWSDCMPLAWRARCGLSVAPALNTWSVWALHLHGTPLLYATTEAEARHQLCRLALWRAWQKKEKEDMP